MAAGAVSAGPRFAPEDPTLPKPWRGLVDGKTGYLYFWNPETNTTQFGRPVPPKPLAPVNSSVQPSSQEQHRHGPTEEDTRYGRGNTDGSKSAAEAKSFEGARNGTLHPQIGNVSTGNGGSSAATSAPGPLVAGSSQSAESYRRQHEVTVSGDDVPAPFISFEATDFPSELLREGAIFAPGRS